MFVSFILASLALSSKPNRISDSKPLFLSSVVSPLPLDPPVPLVATSADFCTFDASSDILNFAANHSFSFSSCFLFRSRPSGLIARAASMRARHASEWPRAGVPAMRAAHPRHPWVKPCFTKSSLFNRTRFTRTDPSSAPMANPTISSSVKYRTLTSSGASSDDHCQGNPLTFLKPSPSHRRSPPTRLIVPALTTPSSVPMMASPLLQRMPKKNPSAHLASSLFVMDFLSNL